MSRSGSERGATREELLRSVVTPSTNINEFEQSLIVLQKLAPNFHPREGRFLFDPEENTDAKVEYRSISIPENHAQDAKRKLWLDEVFRDSQVATVLVHFEKTREVLEGMETGRLRFVLSPKRLGAIDRHRLYHGLKERNQIILLEPNDSKFEALGNRDLIRWGQRVVAAPCGQGNFELHLGATLADARTTVLAVGPFSSVART